MHFFVHKYNEENVHFVSFIVKLFVLNQMLLLVSRDSAWLHVTCERHFFFVQE
jgi:hypothetical protein